MNDAELDKAEREALKEDCLLGQLLARAISEIRRLRHELEDPNFMYARGRIHRQAIVCRNEEIDKLRAIMKERRQELPQMFAEKQS